MYEYNFAYHLEKIFFFRYGFNALVGLMFIIICFMTARYSFPHDTKRLSLSSIIARTIGYFALATGFIIAIIITTRCLEKSDNHYGYLNSTLAMIFSGSLCLGFGTYFSLFKPSDSTKKVKLLKVLSFVPFVIYMLLIVIVTNHNTLFYLYIVAPVLVLALSILRPYKRLWKNLSQPTQSEHTEPHLIPEYCGNCGEKISNGDRFCGKCGQTISKANSFSTTSPHKSKFKRILWALIKTALTIGYLFALVALIIAFRLEAQEYDERNEAEKPYREVLLSLYIDDSLENAISVINDFNFGTISQYKEEICTELINILEKHVENELYNIPYTLAYINNKIGNYDKQAYWCLQGVKSGDSRAMNTLGIMYQNGRGVNQDSKKALEYIRMAAYSGDMNGAYNYACRFEIGVYKRYETVWIKDPDCYDCKYKGDKCEKHTYRIGKELILKANMDSARYWWKKAADMGMEDAKDKLMKIYD